MKNQVFILCGPTSTGKTSLAIQLAKEFNGEIISADSRQIYKNMDIGTGKKPIIEEFSVEKHDEYWTLDGIKIWGYDLVSGEQYFSAYDFAVFALNKAKELLEKGKNVFLVGGTGLYIDIFTGRAGVAQVNANLELRKNLEILTKEQLLAQLTSLNVDKANKIDKDNKIRIIRAIEVETGEVPNTTPLPHLTNTNFTFIGLTADRQLLYSRADSWLEKIWVNGLLDEVRALTGSPKLNGLVYKSALAFIVGALSEEEAKQRAKFDLHAYIRRQQTWFKRNKDIIWFDITQENFSQKIKDQVKSTLNG